MTDPDALDEDSLFAILATGAATDDGEAVDQLSHALQCAALLSERSPADTELWVAGLVHDIGSILAPGAPAHHATIGARAVRRLLGDRVATLVAEHDRAKRYLVATDRAYLQRLSTRSVATLEVQGGRLTGSEIEVFEGSSDLEACLALRCADDDAKVVGRSTPTLESWRATVATVAGRARVAPDDS